MDIEQELPKVWQPQAFLLLILLTLCGYLGNYFSINLFFGVDFLFGSIFTLLAVYLYGEVQKLSGIGNR